MKYAREAIIAARNSGKPGFEGIIHLRNALFAHQTQSQADRDRVAREILKYSSPEILALHKATPGTPEADRILAEYRNTNKLLAVFEEVEESTG